MIVSNMLIDVIKKLTEVCRKEKIHIVLIGGIAASYYARPRATFDIDGIVSVKRADLGKFLKRIKQEGFDYDNNSPVKIIQGMPLLTILHKKFKIYVDLFIAESKFQKEILGRARKIRLKGKLIDIISPEDLILLKLLTGRERDVDDVRNIIIENSKTLDLKYLNKWADRLSIKVFLDDEIKSLGRTGYGGIYG